MTEPVKITLNGSGWKYKCDPEQQGEEENWHDPMIIEKKWDDFSACRLPQCWNTISEEGTLPYDRYEGVFWFFKHFALSKKIDSNRDCLVRFNGVNYYCKAWINGRYLGDHEGGFLPFQLKIPNEVLKQKNYLVIEVENFRRHERIPSLSYDWHNWSGIYRDIDLLVVPKKRILRIHIVTEHIDSDSAELTVTYSSNERKLIRWQVLQATRVILEGKTASRDKLGMFTIKIPNPRLWSPATPDLYVFQAQIVGREELARVRFGIRKIEVRSSGIYLNNERIQIRGVSLHEELIPYGRTIDEKDRLNDLEAMKRLGFNTLRTAHYSHDEKLIELADEIGIMILEEIPVYWQCDFANPSVLKLASKMIRDLIYRDFNHPSVILWSVGNEVPIENRVCCRFMNHLVQLAKKIDSSRIVTYVSSRMFCDPLRNKLDLPCLNEYFGWYYLSERNLNLFLDLIHQTDPLRPLLITEFGADAKYGFHSRKLQKNSEEKQASILSHSIETFNSKDYIAGWIVWLYRDFRSPLRTNKYQQGYNRKGILSEKNEPKLITRMIRNPSSKTPKKRQFHILPKFSFISRLIELFVVGILFSLGQKLGTRRKFEKYYSRTPLYSEERKKRR